MRLLYLALVLAVAMPSCSHFTPKERQNRTYERYIKKTRAARDKRRKELKRSPAYKIPPAPPVSEPQIRTSTGE